jgi:antitoxin MazE
MKTRIQKWGNSLAVRIPKSFAEGLRFGENSPAEITLEEGAILIRPDRDRLWDLDELLARVTDDNLPPVWGTDAGPAAAAGRLTEPVGRDPEDGGEVDGRNGARR